VALTPFRTLLTVLVGTALALGGTAAEAQIVPAPTTSTTAPVPTTTATTAVPARTQILPATTTTAAAPETKILVDPAKAAQPGGSTTTTTSAAPGPTTTAVPPPSLTPGQVDGILQGQVRSGANSTAALLDALKPLQNFGMTATEALALGMGQFPVQGLANWTDDFGAPRDGPPPHPHQGNDLFTQFDTPVRAPADGVVRFASEDLGGLAAYVTTPDGTYYYMAHLDSFATDLASGAAVTQGRIVGYAGDTGNAKGGPPHVHFEIHPRGGPAVDPKPIIDGWVAAALAHAPDLIASFQPPPAADGSTGDGTLPQILVATGLTRRFSAPSLPVVPPHAPSSVDFDRAVLGPLTPSALAPLLRPAPSDA
jgi:murein DD-endopeptidase MepM/ murein hydrolase activator NlpD